MAERQARGLDALVINTSGCGTSVKDYGHLFARDAIAADAAAVAAMALDVSEVVAKLGLPEGGEKGLRVAYHSACSLQHGQKITMVPKQLLKKAGFVVRDPAEGHLCCGSAGTYSVLQPALSKQLRQRKLGHLGALEPTVITSANIGCITHLQSGTETPVRHWVQVLDAALAK